MINDFAEISDRRRAQVCGSEQGTVAHELGKVCVYDAVALLDGIVAREDVLGIVVANLLQRGVFAVFSSAVVHHCHACLHVGVSGVASTENEIAFKRAYSSYACRIAVGKGVGVDHILKRRPVVDPVVGIGGEVESKVGKVVFLLASDGTSGFEVEAAAFIQNLGIFQNADVPVQRFALDARPRLFKVRKEVVETCRRAEVVDKVRLDLLKCGKIAYLYAPADIFLEYLGNDALNVCSAVVCGVVLDGLRKSSATQILIELIDNVGGDAFAEKSFHAKEFVEGEREHFEFKVSSGQFRDKLAAQEVGIGSCYENGMPPLDAEGIDHLLKPFYVLDFVDEEIGRTGGRRLFVDEPFKAIRGLDVFIRTAVKIEVDNVRIIYAAFAHLIGNCLHKAGFAATSDASDYFYEPRVFIKAANLAEIVFSSVVLHGRKYSTPAANSQVKGVNFC